MATFGPVEIATLWDDCYQQVGTVTATSLDGDGIVFGSRNSAYNNIGMRWQNVTIPQGATISAASIVVESGYESGSGSISGTIYGVDADNAAAFNNDTEEPSDKTLTTASATWDYDFPGAGNTLTSPDLTDIVQEIVDRDSWASGNAMAFVWESNDNSSGNWAQVESSQTVSSGEEAPILEITYTTGAGTDALTGSDLTGGTPTLDTPTIGQTHSLTGSEVTSGTPTLDTPTIGQTHGLTGTEVTGATPTLDTPTVGQTHALTGTEITSDAPTLGTPTLAEGMDNLTSTDLTGSAPVLDTPTLGQVHTLTGSELTSSAPTLDTPTVGQVHGLTGTEITGGTPTLESPTVTEVVGTDVLTSADLLGGTPVLDTPTLGQVHALSGTDILGGVSIDSPALGQVHTLTATEITGAAPTLGTPTLSDFLYLFVENFTGTSTMTTTKAGASAMTTEYAETSAFN